MASPPRKRHASFQILLLLRATTAQRAHVDVVVPTRQGFDLNLAHIESGFLALIFRGR